MKKTLVILALSLGSSIASAKIYDCQDAAGNRVVRQDADTRQTKSFQDDNGSVYSCKARPVVIKHPGKYKSTGFFCAGKPNWTPTPLPGCYCVDGQPYFPVN